MSSRSSSSSLEVERRPVARQPLKSAVEVKQVDNVVAEKPQEQVKELEQTINKQQENGSKNNDKIEKRSRSSSSQRHKKKRDSSPNNRDYKRQNRDKREYSRRSRSRSPQYRSRRDDNDRKYRDDKDYNRDRRRREESDNDNSYRNKSDKQYKEDVIFKSKDNIDSRSKRYSPNRNNKRDSKNYRDDKYTNRRRSHSRNRSSEEEKNRSHRNDDRNNKKYYNRDDQQEKKLDIRKHADDMYGKKTDQKGQKKEEEKPEENQFREEPCWIPSGILAKYQNNVNGVTLKFTKPLDAEKPKEKWSLYPFKGDQQYDVIRLKGDSAFLVGKDPRVSYILCDNPTVSSQHAVIQFREFKQMDYSIGQYTSIIRPYIIDLESTNGTYLNNEKIDSAKYIQLLPKDILKFGQSNREYVLIKEN